MPLCLPLFCPSPLSVSVCFLISCPCSLNFSHLCDSIDPISLHIYIYFFFFEVVVSVLHIAAFSSSVFLAPFTFCIVFLFGYLLLLLHFVFCCSLLVWTQTIQNAAGVCRCFKPRSADKWVCGILVRLPNRSQQWQRHILDHGFQGGFQP